MHAFSSNLPRAMHHILSVMGQEQSHQRKRIRDWHDPQRERHGPHGQIVERGDQIDQEEDEEVDTQMEIEEPSLLENDPRNVHLIHKKKL